MEQTLNTSLKSRFVHVRGSLVLFHRYGDILEVSVGRLMAEKYYFEGTTRGQADEKQEPNEQKMDRAPWNLRLILILK